jgi:hypothetical protein
MLNYCCWATHPLKAIFAKSYEYDELCPLAIRLLYTNVQTPKHPPTPTYSNVFVVFALKSVNEKATNKIKTPNNFFININFYG